MEETFDNLGYGEDDLDIIACSDAEEIHGIVTSRAGLVTDAMIAAATRAVSDMSDVSLPGATLLPMVSDLRRVSEVVAVKVVKQAIKDGVTQIVPDDVEAAVKQNMWQPVYPKLSFDK